MGKVISGEKIIKILCREFGFYFVSQKGSHVKLRKTSSDKIITIIPLHKELVLGTLKGILELAKVEEDDFFKKL